MVRGDHLSRGTIYFVTDPERQEAVSLAIERTKLELGDHCERQ